MLQRHTQSQVQADIAKHSELIQDPAVKAEVAREWQELVGPNPQAPHMHPRKAFELAVRLVKNTHAKAEVQKRAQRVETKERQQKANKRARRERTGGKRRGKGRPGKADLSKARNFDEMYREVAATGDDSILDDPAFEGLNR